MGLGILGRVFRAILVPFLAVVSAIVLGALIMLAYGDDPLRAYQGLWEGAFGSARAWSTTVRKWTPLILTGLSVAVAFKAGLFNIGASGQFMMGTVCSVAVGVNFAGLPAFIHLPLAIMAGIAGGRAIVGPCRVSPVR
jgi:simple sugar transport system permease protein